MKRMRRIAKLVLLLLGWLLLSANAVVFNNATGWSLWLFFSGFLLLTLVACGPSLKRVQLQTASVHYGQVGQTFSLPVAVKAQRFWLAFFQVGLKEDGQVQSFYFYHGQTLHLTFSMKLQQRGRFEQPPLMLCGGDLFGLLLKEQTRRLTSTLYVLPKEDVVGRKLGQDMQKQLTSRLFGDVLPQIKGYREYRYGDNRRQVDWKVSARQKKLTIREQEVGQEVRPLFLFWGQQGQNFEKALSRYYSLQKEVGLGVEQYLLGQKTQLVEDERVFAELSGFSEAPSMPLWRDQDLFIFYGEDSEQLQENVAQWRRTNRVRLIPLLQEAQVSDWAIPRKQVRP